MALKDWTNDLMDSTDSKLGNIQVWRKKNGLRPYVESIELRKVKSGRYKGDIFLIGHGWDLKFQKISEARAFAIDYMRTH